MNVNGKVMRIFEREIPNHESLTLDSETTNADAGANMCLVPSKEARWSVNKLRWLLVIALLCIAKIIFAQSPVALSVNPAIPGAVISPDFIGLSYEMSLVNAGPDGTRFFSPKNTALVSMFRTLGVKSLRVGGNSADRLTVKEPDRSDIDQLFAFAEAAGVKVIYTLRLNGSKPATAARTSKYILDHYKHLLTAFAIGNEPDKQFQQYSDYRDVFQNYLQAITSNAPDASICGPGAMQKNVAWAKSFATDFAGEKHVAFVTQHEYPAGSGRRATNILAGCENLLSTNLVKVYENFHDSFVPPARNSQKPYRLEEANNYSNGGAASVSDAFASSLWALDYMYWWASHGAEGINFHTGGYSGPVAPLDHMKYVVFWNAPDGFAAHPLAYGLKAFDLGAHGHLVPVTMESNVNNLKLTAYAIISDDSLLYVTLINKETAKDAFVTLSSPGSIQDAKAMFLSAANHDIMEKSKITLGDAAISDRGRWRGIWTPEVCTNNRVAISIPEASAVILRIGIVPLVGNERAAIRQEN